MGIFRPYRSSESLPQIRKLSLLFLDYSSEFSPTANSASSSTRGTEASKTVKLHRFKEELRFAEIHDLVSVLKWVHALFSLFFFLLHLSRDEADALKNVCRVSVTLHLLHHSPSLPLPRRHSSSTVLSSPLLLGLHTLTPLSAHISFLFFHLNHNPS